MFSKNLIGKPNLKNLLEKMRKQGRVKRGNL
jgi:hypothetical protein